MLAGVVVSGSVLALIPDLSLIAKGLVLGLLGFTALRMWRLWRYPAVVELRDAKLRWRILGHWCSTGAENIARLELHGKQLALQFVDAGAVSGPLQRLSNSSSFAAAGFHTALPMGDVTLWQTNQLRAALGWEPQLADERGQELNAFVRDLRTGTATLWVTPTLVALNVAAFLGLWWIDSRSGRSNLFSFESGLPPELLLQWGANYGPRTSAGEWWRLLTSVFLHGNLIHIGFNMWVLLSVGRLVERLLGNFAYLTTYLFAGICGSLASVWWNRTVVSVGASGAIFGLFGVLLGLVIRHRNTFPPEIVRVIRSQSLTFLVANLALGTQIKGIDMAAHVGGALGGLFCGFAISPRTRRDGSRRGPWPVVGLLATCAAATAVGVATLPPPQFDLRQTLLKVIDLEEQVERSLVAAEDQARKEDQPDQVLRRLDEALQPWKALRQQVAEANHVAAMDRGPREKLQKFLSLQQESWEHLAKALANNDLSERGRGILLNREAQKEIRELVEADGDRLGFRLKGEDSNLPAEGE